MNRQAITSNLPDVELLDPKYDEALLGIATLDNKDTAIYSQRILLAILERDMDSEAAFAVLEQSLIQNPNLELSFFDDVSFEGE